MHEKANINDNVELGSTFRFIISDSLSTPLTFYARNIYTNTQTEIKDTTDM